MIDKALSFLAPHLCSGCGVVGTLLCDNCKYDITHEPESRCLQCGKAAGLAGVCSTCKVPYSRAWYVGDRTSTLQRLVGLFKFERAKAGYVELAELLLERLPQLPPETVIVPVPTVRSHVRQRGYDHTALIACYIAKAHHITYQSIIGRKTNTMQRGANAGLRKKQADQAFGLTKTKVDTSRPYLVIDDVTTTGATLIATTKLLKDAGAKDVWVAVVARQPLG